MPAVSTGKVLVTGANGYIAVWVVKSLLDAGFAVCGTVRSESKASHLRTIFASFGDKLEVVVVDDITKVGAFDAHVADVDAIAHTASPFHLKADEPDELIIPAVQGTLGPLVLNEADWNDEDVVTAREKGRAAEGVMKYRASKSLAERAAWAFVDKENAAGPALGWDLVVLNPPFVFGPFLHEVAKPEDLNQSAHDWYFNVVKCALDDEARANVGYVAVQTAGSFVDVRDIAQAHVLALLKPDAAGSRLIISSDAYKWQDWVNAAHKIEPSLPAGNTSYDRSKAIFPSTYDHSRAITTLGLKFRTIAETTKDTLEDFKARGWL
ncbi:NAD-P-binding protein [Trametes gibbosa]|nr:NAD-P-binding protein [Trametes gibbosa]